MSRIGLFWHVEVFKMKSWYTVGMPLAATATCTVTNRSRWCGERWGDLCMRPEGNTCRMWIWIGVGYNVGLGLLLTILSGVALQFCNPVKMRPTTAADESAAKSAVVSAEIRKKRTERLIKSSARHSLRLGSVRATLACHVSGHRRLVSSLPRQCIQHWAAF